MDEVLEMLARPQGASGEEICKRLGITRAAVWKRVEKLRAQGFDIRGAGRNGYRIVPPEDPLHPVFWRNRLDTRWAGHACAYLPSVDSTNAEGKRLAAEGAPHGQLVLAEEQTAGRGRRGRAWASPPGSGLWMSLVLRPEAQAERLPSLALLLALSVAEACEACGGGITAKVKWPNDVVIGGRKVCGILLEMAADLDGAQWVVAGIGINTRQREGEFPPEFRRAATSLALEAAQPPRRADLLLAFLRALEARYDRWAADGVAALREEHARRSVTLGQVVRVVSPAETFAGMAEAIDDTGALLVRRAQDGELCRVLAADVSVRGVMDYA